jgi:hypothetical protein
MSTRRVLVWLSLATATAAHTLAAQAPRLEGRVDAATLAAVQPALTDAARDSLPLAALESKVLEGVAKAVPPQQIGRVVADLATEFRAARAVVREGLPGRPVTDGEVVAVALAVRQGVAPEMIRALWASRPNGGSLEIPVTVLSELVRRGVPVEDAANVVGHVVRTGVPAHVAAQLPGRVETALGAGVAPGAALGEAMRALNIPQPPGRPESAGPPGRRPGG